MRGREKRIPKAREMVCVQCTQLNQRIVGAGGIDFQRWPSYFGYIYFSIFEFERLVVVVDVFISGVLSSTGRVRKRESEQRTKKNRSVGHLIPSDPVPTHAKLSPPVET